MVPRCPSPAVSVGDLSQDTVAVEAGEGDEEAGLCTAVPWARLSALQHPFSHG